MLIALRFNLSVDYNIELPQNKAKTNTAATSKAEASSSFKGFEFFKTLNTTWFNNDGCLYGFAGDQMEVRGHLELRTTFTDGVASRTENIRYLVVNAVSAYNILLGRPSLNRLRAVASTRHMKMKSSDLSGRVITFKSDQQEAKRCYENNLKTKKGVFMFTERPPGRDEDARAKRARERRPEPVGDIVERQIGGRTFKLGKSLN